MDVVDPFRFLFAFIFVLGLIGLMAAGLRYWQKARGAMMTGPSGSGRVRVVETHYIEPKRKLVLVRRDDKEHLLLLADGRETVIESNIEVKDV